MTLSEVNAAIRALEKQSRPCAVAILARFGARVTPELKAENYEAVLDTARAALAEIEANGRSGGRHEICKLA